MAKLVTGPRSSRARADDLAVLHPDRIVWIRGEQWTVREYSLLEASRLYTLGAEAHRTIGENKPNWRAIVALLAASTGRGEYEIGALEDDDFERLYSAWRDLNLSIFEPSTTKQDSRLRWSDLHATLIAAGHTREQITGYTARQVDLYYGAALKRERREQAKRISDVNIAMSSAKKARERIEALMKSTP